MAGQLPSFPKPPKAYASEYIDQLIRILTIHLQQLNAVSALKGSALNLNIDTLPTEADVAELRTGDVYRDSTAGNVLKIKV